MCVKEIKLQGYSVLAGNKTTFLGLNIAGAPTVTFQPRTKSKKSSEPMYKLKKINQLPFTDANSYTVRSKLSG